MALNVPSLLNSRLVVKGNWENDFQTNHEKFAKDIATGFAKHIIQNLTKRLEDPYNRLPGPKREEGLSFYLGFTFSGLPKLQEMFSLAHLQNETNLSAPFDAWLKKCLSKNNNDHHFKLHNGSLDNEYFNERLAVVGKLAEENLCSKIEEIVKDTDYSDLKYKIEWYQSSEEENISSFSKSFGPDNSLRMTFWLDKEVTSDSTVDSKVMKTRKLRLKNIQARRMQKTKWLVGSLAAAFFAALIFMNKT